MLEIFDKVMVKSAWQICELASAQHVDLGVARDMFVANLNNYGVEGAEFYEGADVDYETLSAEWKAMTPEEQAEEKTYIAKIMKENYEALSECRRNGDEAGYYAVILTAEQPEPPVAPDYVLYRHAWEIYDRAIVDGISVEDAEAAFISELEADGNTDADAVIWVGYTEDKKQEEKDWFSFNVLTDDRNLAYAYKANNKALFEAILMG